MCLNKAFKAAALIIPRGFNAAVFFAERTFVGFGIGVSSGGFDR